MSSDESKVIFKQWIYNPNSMGTPLRVGGMLNYIATRDGVELGSCQSKEKTYVDYIATRPRVSTDSLSLDNELRMLPKMNNLVEYDASHPHGLFGKLHTMKTMNDIVDLETTREYVENLAKNKTTIYNAVISLREDDAVAKEMLSKGAWAEYVQAHINDIAREMNIPPRCLEWVGAVHMEPGHPHIHLMYWDTEQKVSVQNIDPEKSNTIRKKLIDEMFKDEVQILRHEKDKYSAEVLELISKNNDSLLNEARSLIDEVYNLTEENKDPYVILNRRSVEAPAEALALSLENFYLELKEKYTKGSFKYDFLSPELKASLDAITKQTIERCPQLAKAYKQYIDVARKQAQMYGGKKNINYYVDKERRSLYKKIGNKILQVVAHDIKQNYKTRKFLLELNEKSLFDLPVEELEVGIERTVEYKNAREYLLGTEDIKQDFLKAIKLLQIEAKKGNVLAMFDLGRMYADGLGVQINNEKAHDYYAQALEGFVIVNQDLQQKAEKNNYLKKNKPWKYTEYRIAKMYAQGLGTEQDFETALEWFSLSAEKDYKFAEYSLAGQYTRGQGAEQNFERAFGLYLRSAEQGFPYANFEVAKMYRDGVGTSANDEKSQVHFTNAFKGFVEMEKANHDDKVQYRLGWMLQNGIGTKQDILKAKTYYEKSAKLGNTFACFALAKIILADENADKKQIEEAIRCLELASENGNQFAQYALGKLYLNGELIEQDVDKGIAYLEQSAGQGNQFAQYALGKMICDGKIISCDVSIGVHYLKKSAEQGNQFAQCKLGEIYLDGKIVPQDKQLANYYLNKSAEQGNEYAKYLLNYPIRNLLLTIDLLQNILNIISSHAHKNQNKRMGHDLTKGEKKQIAKERKEKSLEWGD